MNKDLKIVKTGFALLLITIISKIAAFFVTIVFSYYFGTDSVTDAYYAGGTVPNLVNTSLAVCALTLFIPVYARCLNEKGREAANEFTSNILNLFVIFNIALFIVVCVLSPVLAKLVAPGFDALGLEHTRRMICLLSMSFPVTIAAYTFYNLYNANQKYILPSIMTLLNHMIVIAGTIIVAPRIGIYAYPFICTGAWVVQLIILILFSNKKIFNYIFILKPKNKYFCYMLAKSIPVMVATAADQINLAADNIISSSLSTGSISCIGYAHRIFNSINGLVTATLLTIYYPIISKQYAEKNSEGVDSSIRKYIDMMLLLTLPLMGLLIINSDAIIDILFNRGAMDGSSIGKISLLFIIYVAGLQFITTKEFSTRLFYIIGNTKTPTMINVFCVVLNVCLSLTFKQFIGIYGIAFATTTATGVCAFIECASLIRQVGGKCAFHKHRILNKRNIGEIIIACIVATGISYTLKLLVAEFNAVISILFSGISYCIIFFVIMIVTKNEYIIKLKEYILARI